MKEHIKLSGGFANEHSTIYVRSSSKRATILKLPSRCRMADLQKKIAHKFKISEEDQVLVLHGKLVPITEKYIILEDQYIFHVINIKRVKQAQITISLKKIIKDPQVHKFTLSSHMKIGDFIHNRLGLIVEDVSNYFLVYTGRELQAQKSFQQEYIQDQSQILCVHKQQNLKKKTIEIRKISNLYQDKSQTFQFNNSLISSSKKQQTSFFPNTLEFSSKSFDKGSYIPIKQHYSFIKKSQIRETDKKIFNKRLSSEFQERENQKNINEINIAAFQQKNILTTFTSQCEQEQFDENSRKISIISNPQESISKMQELQISRKTYSSPEEFSQEKIRQREEIYIENTALGAQNYIQQNEEKGTQENYLTAHKKTFSGKQLEKIEQQEEIASRGSRGQSIEDNPSSYILNMVQKGETERKEDNSSDNSQKLSNLGDDFLTIGKEMLENPPKKSKSKIIQEKKEGFTEKIMNFPFEFSQKKGDSIENNGLYQRKEIDRQEIESKENKQQQNNLIEDEGVSIKYLERIHGKINQDDQIIELENGISGIYGMVPSSIKIILQKKRKGTISLNTTDNWEKKIPVSTCSPKIETSGKEFEDHMDNFELAIKNPNKKDSFSHTS